MPAKKATQFKWIVAKEEHFLECLVNAVKAGQRTDNGWKPQVAANVIASFANNHHGVVARAQLKNKSDNVILLDITTSTLEYLDKPNSYVLYRSREAFRLKTVAWWWSCVAVVKTDTEPNRALGAKSPNRVPSRVTTA